MGLCLFVAVHVGSGSALQIRREVARIAYEEGVEMRLAEAVAEVESGYGAGAVSGKGAVGIMQLMPQTALGLGVKNRFSSEENIRAGVRYLRALLLTFGDLRLALAAYNAGPGAVMRFGGVPPYIETRSYVAAVIGRYYGHRGTEKPVRRVVAAPARGYRPKCIAVGDSAVIFRANGEITVRTGSCGR